MAEECITPLLDGLDEIIPEYRDACVEAINQFHNQYRGVGLVVCSRIHDYETLHKKLSLKAAILLQALDDRQVDAVLSRPELAAAKGLLKTEPWLPEMAKTPFLLNVMSYAYSNCTPAQLRLPATDHDAAARRIHLFDAYIARRLTETRLMGTRGLRIMTAHRTRELLAWLASNMIQRDAIPFHLENLQMNWLTRTFFRNLYCLISRIAFAIIMFGVIWAVTEAVIFLAIATGITPAHEAVKSAQQSTEPPYWWGMLFLIGLLTWIFYLSGICACCLHWASRTKSLNPVARIKDAVGVIGASFAVFSFVIVPWLAIIVFNGGGHPPSVWSFTSFASLFYLTGLISGFVAAWPSFFLKVRTGVAFHAFNGALNVVGVMSMLLLFGAPNHTKQDDLFYALLTAVAAAPMAIGLGLVGMFGDQIQTAEQIHWKFNWRAAIWWTVPFCLSMTVYLIYSALTTTGTDAAATNIVAAIAFGVTGIIFGAVGGSLFGFHRVAGIQRRLVPNEGVFRSIKNAAFLAIAFGIAAAILSEAGFALARIWFPPPGFDRVRVTAAVMILFAMLGAMIGGFDVPVKHFVLRAAFDNQ